MTETQLAAQDLATAIAGFRLAERAASRAVIVAECAINNVAGQYGIRLDGRSVTQQRLVGHDITGAPLWA